MIPSFVGSNPATPAIQKEKPFVYDSLAQTVEHVTFNHGVRGSNPRWVTKKIDNPNPRPPLAQLVEQLTLNQWVLGSSPRWCTKRLVGQAVKTPASHAGNTSSILVRVTNQIGAYGAEVTPVPFPNTEVKLCRDDDTWLATAWESNAVPVLMFLLSSVGRALGC